MPPAMLDRCVGTTAATSTSAYASGNRASRLPNSRAIPNGRKSGATASVGTTVARDWPPPDRGGGSRGRPRTPGPRWRGPRARRTSRPTAPPRTGSSPARPAAGRSRRGRPRRGRRRRPSPGRTATAPRRHRARPGAAARDRTPRVRGVVEYIWTASQARPAQPTIPSPSQTGFGRRLAGPPLMALPRPLTAFSTTAPGAPQRGSRADRSAAVASPGPRARPRPPSRSASVRGATPRRPDHDRDRPRDRRIRIERPVLDIADLLQPERRRKRQRPGRFEDELQEADPGQPAR